MTVSRELSPEFRNAIERQESDIFPLLFMRVTHPALADTVRIVNNSEDVKLSAFDADELRYIGFQFDITILSDGDKAPSASLSVQNVDRVLSNALLKAVDPAIIELEIYSSALFDESVIPHVPIAENPLPEFRAIALELYDVSVTGETISGTLRSRDYSQETYPGLMATENRTPGLFW